MKNSKPSISQYIVNIHNHLSLLVLFAFLTILTPIVYGQNLSRGTTPIGMAPGSPNGSYALSEFEDINLFNGKINFRLSLLKTGGRGNANSDIILPLNLPPWMVKSETTDLGAHYTWPQENDSLDYFKFLGIGSVTVRYGGAKPSDCTSNGGGIRRLNYVTLTRITFTLPDGTEYELRDKLTDGKPYEAPYSSDGWCSTTEQNPFNRGRVFSTADGTSATFISDWSVYDDHNPYATDADASGELFLADGTKYRVDNGVVTSKRDRNGNKLTYTFNRDTSGVLKAKIIDSLNREINIEYDIQDIEPYGLCDRIIFKGANGLTQIIRISKRTLSGSLRQTRNGSVGYTLQTYGQLFPELKYSMPGGSENEVFNPNRVSKVWLPDGHFYSLFYNSFGELARVDLPTGGSYEYDWGGGFHSSSSGSSNGLFDGWLFIYRRVEARRVYRETGELESIQTFSKPESQLGMTSFSNAGYVDREYRNGQNNLLGKERHYFYGSSAYSFYIGEVNYNAWRDGKEYKTEYYDASGNLIKKTEQVYEQKAPVTWWADSNYPSCGPCTPENTPANDPRVTSSTTTLYDVFPNKVTKQVYDYDQYNNVTDIYEYDFGTDNPGELKRKTHTDYLTNGYDTISGDAINPNPSATIHIRNLPTREIIYDAGGNQRSLTAYEYDNYSSGNRRAPLIDRPNISGLDSSYTTSNQRRGNVTAISSWLDNPSGYITAFQQYDIAGNVVKKIDGLGTEITFDFSDRFGYPDGEVRSNTGPTELGGQVSFAFQTKVTNAIGHEAYAQYDYYLGKAVDLENANGIISSAYHNDPLNRPTQIINAVNIPSLKSQVAITYNDINRIITTTKDLNSFGDNKLRSEIYFDGFGRVNESRKYENETSYIKSRTEYDSLGRPYRKSKPHRLNETATWTTTSYDALGRVVDVETEADHAHIITQYSGNQVTVRDQAGKTRKSETDALGRLIKVIEDPGGLNYETFYSYDVLGNIVKVVQGAQSRWFAYDSLSRLIRVKNPEQDANYDLPPFTDPVTGGSGWAMAYSYDANGNIVDTIDARGVKTMVFYDALNRVTKKVYAGITAGGTAAASLTRPVHYYYDDYGTLPSGAPTLSGGAVKGQLIGVRSGDDTEGTYYKYDQLGRIVTNHQRTGAANNLTTYEYNLAGNVTAETRGDRRKIIPIYDEIGRLKALNTSTNPYNTSENLLNDVSYTSFGAIKSEVYGNGLVHKIVYNNRLQQSRITLGTAESPELLLKLDYIYGTANNPNDAQLNTLHNNGNVGRVNYYIDGALQNSQTYQYDPLNRIQYAVEHKNGILNDASRAWYQNYSYDRYGNKQQAVQIGTSEQLVDQVLVDDSLPQGAVTWSDGGDSWNWVSSNPVPLSGGVSHQSNIADTSWSPPPVSGNVSHQSNIAQGVHQHYYWGANLGGQVFIPYNSDYKLYASIYLDPQNVPEEIMLQWGSTTEGWNHRAYWGANKIGWGTDGTTQRWYMGSLPQAGGWVRLEVPASAVGLDGKVVDSMAFTLYGGRANWDMAGVEGINPQAGEVCEWDPYDNTYYCHYEGEYQNTILVDDSVPVGSNVGADGGDSWYWTGARTPQPLAAFVSQSVPETMTAGEAYAVTVTMLNQGNTTWTPEQLYRLGSQNPQDNTTWLGRVNLLPGDSVSPGATTTFSFVVIAPSSPGSYNFQWQMVQDGVEWFGEKTPNIAVQVVPRNDSATFISQMVPSVMEPGTSNSVSITFKNTGNTTWTSANQYRLGSQNPENNGTWGLGRVYLASGETIPPGGSKTFTFTVTAPASPGSYVNFQWRMVHEGVQWFGDYSHRVVVALSPAPPDPRTLSYNESNNRITTAGYNYDTAGNLIAEPGKSYVFDAENRIIKAIIEGGATSEYEYDGNGRRVKKVVAGVTTRFEYGAGGELIAEYDDSNGSLIREYIYKGGQLLATKEPAGSYNYSTSDHLGTSRVWTDQSGNVVAGGRHDYLPFGEELFAGTGNRTEAQRYGTGTQQDGQRKQFIGHERDAETGNDFMQARYFSSMSGRFLSPDSVAGSTLNPQSLNLYTYVLNNPLRYNDPTGNNPESAKDGQRNHDGQKACPPNSYCFNDPKTKTPPPPAGYQIGPDGKLYKVDPIRDSVTITDSVKKGFWGRIGGFFRGVGRALGIRGGGGAVGGAAEIYVGEMIDPSLTVGGRDADIPPLDNDIRSAFLDGHVNPHYLEEDTLLYRYDNGDPNFGSGRWLTNRIYDSPEQAIQELALDQSWRNPNPATHVSAVILPKGTLVYEGGVAPQGNGKYAGYGHQAFVPLIKTTQGVKYGSPVLVGGGK